MPKSLLSTASRLSRRAHLGGEHLVEALHQPLARGEAIDGRVLKAIGHPVIGHAGLAQRLAEGRADLAAGDAVPHPELADAIIRVREGEIVGRQRVREEGGVEVDADLLLLREIHPAGEVADIQLIAIDLLAVGLGVDRVQVQTLLAGDQADGLGEVRAQLIAVAGLAGVVAGGQGSAARAAGAASKPPTSSPCQQCREISTFARRRSPCQCSRRIWHSSAFASSYA